MRTWTVVFFLVLVIVALAPPATVASSASAVPGSRAQINLSFAPLVKKAAPAVVNIYTKRLVRTRRAPIFDDPFFRRFFGDRFPFGQQERQREQNSLGSGVIVRPDGLIVTNHHVIENADEITVVLSDRREYDARVVLRDERTDLAILRINVQRERLPYLELRDSDTLEVGDLVLAIGNPFGVGQTVTTGIVSALARAARGITDFGFFIQTDAAINPGNSGGALVSVDGKLAGINTAIYSRGGGSNGIGFAIPANMVATVIEGVDEGGIVRPWLGARAQQVDPAIAASMGLRRPRGVLVNSVHPLGPAGRAGLKIGDIVVAVDGREISTGDELRFRVAMNPVGSTMALDIIRDGRERRLTVVLQQPPAVPPINRTLIKGRNPCAGAVVGNLSPALAYELSMDPEKTGVIILQVQPGSHADQIGLKEGDILLRVNGRKVDRVKELQDSLSAPADRWRMEVERGGQVLRVSIQG